MNEQYSQYGEYGETMDYNAPQGFGGPQNVGQPMPNQYVPASVQSNPLCVDYKDINGTDIHLDPAVVKNFIAPGAKNITDSEFAMFIQLCKAQKLNPFTKDAYLIKFKDNAQIITSEAALEKRAELSPQYDGKENGIIVQDSAGNISYRKGALILPGETLIGGWCNVYRKDRRIPEHAEVGLKEFDKKTNNWAGMPAIMIQKVAKAHALRGAFPNDLSGLYVNEEMDTTDTPAEPAEVYMDHKPFRVPFPQPRPVRDISEKVQQARQQNQPSQPAPNPDPVPNSGPVEMSLDDLR